jgi:hypothetical protein
MDAAGFIAYVAIISIVIVGWLLISGAVSLFTSTDYTTSLLLVAFPVTWAVLIFNE